MSPDKVRHDDVTLQVPTTLPPQGVPLGQFVPPVLPPLAEELLLPPFPPEFPPELLPPELLPPELLPPEPPFAVVPPEPPLSLELEHAEPRIQRAATTVRSKVRCDINSPQRERDVRRGLRQYPCDGHEVSHLCSGVGTRIPS
jgi:hypothetical protein